MTAMQSFSFETQITLLWLLDRIGLNSDKLPKKILTTSDLIKFLKEDNRSLQFLNEDFRSYFEQRTRGGHPIHMRIYAEQSDTYGCRVVDKESANPNLASITVIEASGKDHFSISKPECNKNDQIFLALNSLVNDLREKVGIFNFDSQIKNKVGLELFGHLKISQNRELLNAVADFLGCEDFSNYEISRMIVELDDSRVAAFLNYLGDLVKTNSDISAISIEKLGMITLQLLMPMAVENFSEELGKPPLLNVPDVSLETQQIFSELVHATFRNWSPKFKLSEDGITLKSGGWRAVSEEVSDPNGWTPEMHVNHVRDFIVASQIFVDYEKIPKNTLAKSRKEADGDEYSKINIDIRSSRAINILRNRFIGEVALIIEASPSSPLNNPEVQRILRARFDNLVALVIQTTENNQELDNNLQGLQVVAQRFLSAVNPVKVEK